jgi:quinoprotein glucose dehydrogenase
LAPAWRIETGQGGLQTTPLVIDGVLYAMTPDQQVLAVDGATGREMWRRVLPDTNLQPVRGLSYWSMGASGACWWEPAAICMRSIRRRARQSPDLGIMAGWIAPWSGPRAGQGGACADDACHDLEGSGNCGFSDGETAPAAPGAIRAYDVRTGALRWTFHTIPQAGQPGSETWPKDAWKTAGGANSWAGAVVDRRAASSLSPPDRRSAISMAQTAGNNLYANSLVALDARTGRNWHFQLVHHDIQDRDPPSPPVLLTVLRDGRPVDAVAQATKHGVLFLFDRVTGKPLFPIDETPIPHSFVPGRPVHRPSPCRACPRPFTAAAERGHADQPHRAGP